MAKATITFTDFDEKRRQEVAATREKIRLHEQQRFDEHKRAAYEQGRHYRTIGVTRNDWCPDFADDFERGWKEMDELIKSSLGLFPIEVRGIS